MMNNMPTNAKKHRKSTKPESHQTAKMFFFFSSSSDGLVQNCVTLSQWISHKTAEFTLSSAPTDHFFTTLKSHKAVWTGHWRTMASLVTPFSKIVCMHTIT